VKRESATPLRGGPAPPGSRDFVAASMFLLGSVRIGELATLVGVSTRTVRHYRRIGVLPEPARQANGYRAYTLRDAVQLGRVRRLTELGLNLDEVKDALADDAGKDLYEVLAELDLDLALQEQAHPATTRASRRVARAGGGWPEHAPGRAGFPRARRLGARQLPPSMARPKRDSSEARNRIAWATSSAAPTRAIGQMASTTGSCASRSSGVSAPAHSIGLSIGPGHAALYRMLCWA